MSTIRSKDRASLCSFTFADGRKCRSSRFKNHAHLCYSHALKESQANASIIIGRNILNRFSGSYLSACDLTNALGQVFSGVAQDEYINAFSTDHWRDTIHSSVTSNSQNDSAEQDSASEESPEPAAASPK